MPPLFESEGDKAPPFMKPKEEKPVTSESSPETEERETPENFIPSPVKETQTPPDRSEAINNKAAEIFYELYCEKVGGKAFNGDPLPDWEEFASDPNKITQADAWIAVASLASTDTVNFSFYDLIEAAMEKAKDDKVKKLVSLARKNYEALVDKLDEPKAEMLVRKIYLESIEGKLIAAKDMQSLG